MLPQNGYLKCCGLQNFMHVVPAIFYIYFVLVYSCLASAIPGHPVISFKYNTYYAPQIISNESTNGSLPHTVTLSKRAHL